MSETKMGKEISEKYINSTDVDMQVISHNGQDFIDQTLPSYNNNHDDSDDSTFFLSKDLPCIPKFLRTGFSQNIIVGLVALACPGMFNALSGLGNAGGNDPTTIGAMNATLYGFFAVFGYLGGPAFNILGNKLPLFLGALTYFFYAISVYLWGINDNLAPMAIVSAACLGVGAGLFWTSQGAMMLSYSTHDKKGQFTAIFWMIFNLGGVLGGLLTFGIESSKPANSTDDSVSAATYFTFAGIMLLGGAFALLLVVNSNKVVRADGKKVKFEKTKSYKQEMISILKLFKNKYMLLLTPLIFQSNFFYTYEFNYVNGLLFDPVTRGLNSAVFWGMQMVGAFLLGMLFLDNSYMTRRSRAIWGLTFVVVFNIIQWGYAAWYQFHYGYDKGNAPVPLFNYKDTEYATPAILFILCGLADSFVQTYAYWILGAVADSPDVLARYVGYYKGMQSLGACIAWMLDYIDILYKYQLIICMSLAVLFIVPTFIVAFMIKNETEIEEVLEDEEISYAGQTTERETVRVPPKNSKCALENHSELVVA